MNLSKIGKLNSLYEQVKQLDLDISEINRAAMEVANEPRTVVLNLAIEETEKPRERRPSFPFAGVRFFEHCAPASELAMQLSETETLHVLGALIAVKQAKREELICKLEKIEI